MRLDHSDRASQGLLDDLRSDRNMGWVPADGWLTKVAIDGDAPQLSYDLAIDASGAGVPSYVQAGLSSPAPFVLDNAGLVRLLLAATLGVGALLLVLVLGRRPVAAQPLRPQG